MNMTIDTQPFRQEGTITHINARGFGFITSDNGRQTVFVHATALHGVAFDALQGGERVSFEPTVGRDGRLCAGDVQHLDGDTGLLGRPDANGSAHNWSEAS